VLLPELAWRCGVLLRLYFPLNNLSLRLHQRVLDLIEKSEALRIRYQTQIAYLEEQQPAVPPSAASARRPVPFSKPISVQPSSSPGPGLLTLIEGLRIDGLTTGVEITTAVPTILRRT
jgi:hypothetical protein